MVGRWRQARSGWEITNASGATIVSGSIRTSHWMSEVRARLRRALQRETARTLADEVGRWISEVAARPAVLTEVDHAHGMATYDLGSHPSIKAVLALGLGAWPAIKGHSPLAAELLDSLADPNEHDYDLMIAARAEEEWALGLD